MDNRDQEAEDESTTQVNPRKEMYSFRCEDHGTIYGIYFTLLYSLEKEKGNFTNPLDKTSTSLRSRFV